MIEWPGMVAPLLIGAIIPGPFYHLFTNLDAIALPICHAQSLPNRNDHMLKSLCCLYSCQIVSNLVWMGERIISQHKHILRQFRGEAEPTALQH